MSQTRDSIERDLVTVTNTSQTPQSGRAGLDLDALDREFEAHGDPAQMVRWLVDTFPLDRLVVASA
jgi:hypothetical protein